MSVKRILIPFSVAAAVLMAQDARTGERTAMNLLETVGIGNFETLRSMLANGVTPLGHARRRGFSAMAERIAAGPRS